jgi:hypothetical protein
MAQKEIHMCHQMRTIILNMDSMDCIVSGSVSVSIDSWLAFMSAEVGSLHSRCASVLSWQAIVYFRPHFRSALQELTMDVISVFLDLISSLISFKFSSALA